MKYHEATVDCAKCGKPIRFPADGPDQAKISRILGSKMYHDECLPDRAKAMKAAAGGG